MAKQLESIEIFPVENGGHRVVHNFKREAAKKEGVMAGGIYVERPKAEEHFFRTSEECKVLGACWQGPWSQGAAQAQCREHGGGGLLMPSAQDKSAINRMLMSHGLGRLKHGAGLMSQLGFLVQDFINRRLGRRNVGELMLAAASMVGRYWLALLEELHRQSPEGRRQKLRTYAIVNLLCIDEVGYLSFDDKAADLLYEVVNRRYERKPVIVTTNRPFKDWNEVFPSATCIVTLLDRLLHHADVTVIEGDSYRVRESEQETAARRKRK